MKSNATVWLRVVAIFLLTSINKQINENWKIRMPVSSYLFRPHWQTEVSCKMMDVQLFQTVHAENGNVECVCKKALGNVKEVGLVINSVW